MTSTEGVPPPMLKKATQHQGVRAVKKAVWLAPLILMTVLVLMQLVPAIPANAALHETWASVGPREIL
jgi:hypothetical protein